MSKKIWLDPGHGGKDSGAVGCGREEKDDNLRYALELARQFGRQGLEIVITRANDTSLSYNQRTGMERGCDLAICCHRNSAATPSAQGAEIWLHHAAIPSIVEWASDTIERLEAAGMPARQGTVARGVYKGYRENPNLDYYCNSGTQSPSMLMELGFVTSPEDNARFDRDYPKYCRAIVQAACAYLGVAYKDIEQDTEPDGLYRVQVGAFAVEENAKRQAQELREQGYQTIIKQD